MKYNKIIINLFVCLVLQIILLNMYNGFVQDLNNELSYKRYLESEYNEIELDFNNMSDITNKQTQECKIEGNINENKFYLFIGIISLYLISILNFLYYIINIHFSNKSTY